MDILTNQEILESFEIIIDTREQRTPRLHRRVQAMGVPVERATLAFGDYTYNLDISGRKLYDTSGTISPKCIIERKMDIDELAACLGKSRRRFEAEMRKAHDYGSRIYLLCEDGSWDKILSADYRSRFNANALFSSLAAWQVRYDLQIVFCSQVNSGRVIRELLYRDAKERLERGEFDDG